MKEHLENRIKEIMVGLDYEKSLLGSLEKQVADTSKKIAGLSIDLAVYNNALANEEVNQKVGFHQNPPNEDVDILQAEFAKMLKDSPEKEEDLYPDKLPKPMNIHFVGDRLKINNKKLKSDKKK